MLLQLERTRLRCRPRPSFESVYAPREDLAGVKRSQRAFGRGPNTAENPFPGTPENGVPGNGFLGPISGGSKRSQRAFGRGQRVPESIRMGVQTHGTRHMETEQPCKIGFYSRDGVYQYTTVCFEYLSQPRPHTPDPQHPRSSVNTYLNTSFNT